MSLMTVAIFFLFLGPLVFFHELGHFLFARFFGVRVEVFSIGFGPKLFKFKKGDTEYAFSAIPLGGYVKMYGDDPLNPDSVPEEERERSFVHKNKWQRFWIVFGGPLANFILAFVLFWGLSIFGEKVPELKIGVVEKSEEIYKKGFRTGDIIFKVNNFLIRNPTDLLGDKHSFVSSVAVRRQEKEVSLPINLEGQSFFELITAKPPALLKPILVDSFGKEFKIKTSRDNTSLEEILLNEKVSAIRINRMIKGKVSEKQEDVVNFEFVSKDFKERKYELFSIGYYPTDLMIDKLKENSPAARSKLLPKDILVSVNAQKVTSFTELRELVQKSSEKSIEIEYIRDGVKAKTTMTPELVREGEVVRKLIGVYSSYQFLPPSYVWTKPSGLIDSIKIGYRRSVSAISKTFDGFVMLITGRVSFRTIGGPVTIGKVAKDSYDISFSYFLQLMALFSINLGVINLFPIPILDGGHILFIVLEIINRKPLSRKVMEIAQQVGLSIVLLLMFGALFNDFTR